MLNSMETQALTGEKSFLQDGKVKLSILFFVTFLFLLIYAQYRGGRWDMGEQLFIGASNITSAQPLYGGTTEGRPMLNGSPYFPGVAFLSYPISKITDNLYLTENIMLVISVIATFFFAVVLYRLYALLNKKTRIPKVFFCAIFISFLLVSESFMGYSVELKPDVLSLALVMLFMVRTVKESSSLVNHLINALILFAALSLKQQTAIFVLGVFLGNAFLFFKTRSKKYLYDCVVLAVTTAVFILCILQSKSLVLHTISANAGRDFRISILEYINETIAVNQVYILVGLFALAGVLKRLLKSRLHMLDNSTLLTYGIAAALYSVIQFKSGINVGGTQGNVQMILVLLLPLLVYAIETAYGDGFNVVLSKAYYVLITSLLFLAVKYGRTLPETLRNEKNAIAVLKKYNKIIIPGDLVSKTPYQNIASDYYALIHFKLGRLKSDPSITEQYRKAFGAADYFAFHPDQLSENPAMLGEITLHSFGNFRIVDSATARGFGKFYVYKIR